MCDYINDMHFLPRTCLTFVLDGIELKNLQQLAIMAREVDKHENLF